MSEEKINNALDSKAFRSISYGMYIVSSANDGKLNGQIANVFFQVTSEPAKFAVCINKENLTHSFIEKSGFFAVSVLEQDTPMKFIGHFGFKSGRDLDKFESIGHFIGKTGAPVVREHALSYVECRVSGKMGPGSHTLFLGEAVASGSLKEGEPMTYAYYHSVKKGKSPAAAPTYSGEDGKVNKKTEGGMKKYVCDVCGYVYDPEKGDPDSGVEQGTPFEKLPDDWVCPVCGVGKDQFSEQD